MNMAMLCAWLFPRLMRDRVVRKEHCQPLGGKA